jgi:arginyl-tRNA synthetase
VAKAPALEAGGCGFESREVHRFVSAAASATLGGANSGCRPRTARQPSTLLDRIADDVTTCLATGPGTAVGGASAITVEAVIPRRIGDFRVNLGAAAAEALRDRPWLRSCTVVPPNLYLDLTLERLVTLVAEELTPERQLGYSGDPRLSGRMLNLAFCSPNANKPLHVGHGRNMLLGAAIGNILALAGADVRRSCCISDYGMHIFKAVAAYVRYGADATPESTGEKADHFVGRFYAQYAGDPALAHGAASPAELMREWMQGAGDVRACTRQLASWAEQGFDETFREWGIGFEHRFYETQEHAYIERFLAAQTSAGSVWRDDAGRLVGATADGGSIVLTRSDGSPLYMSHMVAAILQRLDVFGPDVQSLLTLTADEQVVPFRQLDALLDRFGYAAEVERRHLTHGLVCADGRNLSSRDGTALTLDHIVAGLAEASDGSSETARARARATLACFLLSRSMDKRLDYSTVECLRIGGRIHHDVEQALRLARRDVGPEHVVEGPRVRRWVMRLAAYPTVLGKAVSRLDPPAVLSYLAELCREFVGLSQSGRLDRRLLSPTRHVVEHALELLNLPSEVYFPSEAAPRAGVAQPVGGPRLSQSPGAP